MLGVRFEDIMLSSPAFEHFCHCILLYKDLRAMSFKKGFLAVWWPIVMTCNEV